MKMLLGLYDVLGLISGGKTEECWDAVGLGNVQLLQKMQQHIAQAWVDCNSCQSQDII